MSGARQVSAPFAVGGTFAEEDPEEEQRRKAQRKQRYSLPDEALRGGPSKGGNQDERIVVLRYPDKQATKAFYTTTQQKAFGAIAPPADPDADMLNHVSQSERIKQLAQLSQRAQQDLASVIERREKLAVKGHRGPVARLLREERGSFGSDRGGSSRSNSPAPGRSSSPALGRSSGRSSPAPGRSSPAPGRSSPAPGKRSDSPGPAKFAP